MIGVCAYCSHEGHMTTDHVIPRSVLASYNRRVDRLERQGVFVPALPTRFLRTVKACASCNIAKGNTKRVPPSWAKEIELLKAHIPGDWRVWDGEGRKVRVLCVWCEKVCRETPATCRRCKRAIHPACRTAHMGRCRKAVA